MKPPVHKETSCPNRWSFHVELHENIAAASLSGTSKEHSTIVPGRLFDRRVASSIPGAVVSRQRATGMASREVTTRGVTVRQEGSSRKQGIRDEERSSPREKARTRLSRASRIVDRLERRFGWPRWKEKRDVRDGRDSIGGPALLSVLAIPRGIVDEEARAGREHPCTLYVRIPLCL